MLSLSRPIAIGCVALAVGLARMAAAQPFTLDQKIKPAELKLQPYHGGGHAEGRLAETEITQTEPTQYFFVQGLSIYSPDYVGVTGEDPSEHLTVSLHKETWEQAHRHGEISGAGHWDARFKTSGEVGIKGDNRAPDRRAPGRADLRAGRAGAGHRDGAARLGTR